MDKRSSLCDNVSRCAAFSQEGLQGSVHGGDACNCCCGEAGEGRGGEGEHFLHSFHIFFFTHATTTAEAAAASLLLLLLHAEDCCRGVC